MTHMSRLALKVLFEDSHIVVVDKLANVLSVQGKKTATSHRRRYAEWKDIILSVYNSNRLSPEEINTLRPLIEYESLPRQKEKFLNLLNRVSKTKPTYSVTNVTQLTSNSHHENIWNEIASADFNLNRIEALSKPVEDISVPEILEEMYGHRIYHIHRLDLETSGVILYAKTSQAASHVMKQFRERLIHKSYVAKVRGFVSKNLTSIDLAMSADLNNRPKQVTQRLN